jgi:hypothetical protein
MPDLSRHLATAATFVLLTAPAWAAGVLELLQREEAPPAEVLCAAAQAPCAPPVSVDGPVRVNAHPAAQPPAPAWARRQSAA